MPVATSTAVARSCCVRRKPKHGKSSESVPVYCRGTRTRQSWESSPPAGLATDGESPSGPPRQSRCLLSNLAAQSAWTAGRFTMHRAVWTCSEGKVTATSVWLAVPVSERGPTLHPVKYKGCVERSVPFTLCWLSTILECSRAILLLPSYTPHASRAIV